MERLVSSVGLLAMIGFAWLLSSHKSRVSWRVVVGGLALQFVLAGIVFYTRPGEWLFQVAGQFFAELLRHVDEGALLVFGIDQQSSAANIPAQSTLLRTFAFGVLPTIIFFSSLMSILYHWGVMQWVVGLFAWLMQKTLNISGAESLSAAANVFVGQTEHL